MNWLPFDYSRCIGLPAGPSGHQIPEDCRECLRRTSPRPAGAVWFIEPQGHPCPNRITAAAAASADQPGA